MENVLTDRYKSLRCIEWNVQAPSSPGALLASETFLFQDQNCQLDFYTGIGISNNVPYPYLNFYCNSDLLMPEPVPVTLRVILDSETLDHVTTSITRENEKIWNCTKVCGIISRRVKFQLIFHVDSYSNEDKCIQTASYMNINIYRGSLPEDFSKLLETGSDPDVVVKCGADSIKTHKLVLSARSNVFRAMLQSDMLEGHTGVMEIQDMDVNYFKEFIMYLYTDVMPELTFDKAKALYKAGDKYDVRSLMFRCAAYLQDILSPENSFECYALADAHSDENLKDIIKTYLLDKKIYLQSEHWLPYYKSFPEAALEVYRLSYEKNQQ